MSVIGPRPLLVEYLPYYNFSEIIFVSEHLQKKQEENLLIILIKVLMNMIIRILE